MFFGGKSKPKENPRDKAIKELEAAFPSMKRQTMNDNSNFEIMFENTARQYFVMKLYLPLDFPTNRPVITVTGGLLHPWIDAHERVVGCDKINFWNPTTSSLVNVVQDCLAQLRNGTSYKSNPALPNQQQRIVAGAGLNVNDPARNQASNAYGRNSQGFGDNPPAYEEITNAADAKKKPVVNQPPQVIEPSIPIPPIPSNFPELKNLSDDQLKRLLNDDVALKQHVVRDSNAVGLKKFRDELRQSTATEILEMQQSRRDIDELYDKVLKLQKAAKDISLEYNRVYNSNRHKYEISEERIFKELNGKLANYDRTSELLGEALENGDQDVQSFLLDYLNQRTMYHALSLKLKHVQRNNALY